MSDFTAAEALSNALTCWACAGDFGSEIADEVWDKAMADACEALGIDPDSPLSLLHWHAVQSERERCARIAETAGRANGPWIADQIRRSDRL